MNGYAVNLYIEGGELDGEEICCGPYADENTAQQEADALAHKGTATVTPLYENAATALSVLP